jgi:hypothetical protein
MAPTRHVLTAELASQIVAFIRAGGFPHVAAEAAGVPREVFADWLRRGREPGGRPPYRDLARGVCQAQAQARLTAEVAALTDRPLDWLRSGPGKETADAAGWTGPARPQPPPDPPPDDALADPRVRQFLADLLDLLAPHPEARDAAARLQRRLPRRHP